jgi:fructose-1-phosphate kinase PfkB-like protein
VGRRQRVFRANIAPLESVVSTVGSGDAFLAGFVSARFEKLELPQCLRQGLAAGAANTLRYGAGVLDPADAHRLLASTDVVELDGAGHAVS